MVISAVLAIIKPVIKLTEKVQQYEEVLTGYRGLESDLKIIVVQIKQSKRYGAPHKTKLVEAVARQGELSKKSPEAKLKSKLENKCKAQILKKSYPPNTFLFQRIDNYGQEQSISYAREDSDCSKVI